MFAGIPRIANEEGLSWPLFDVATMKLAQIVRGAPTSNPTQGFTLLELLVVVGIIVTLSSIAWPLWQNHVASSQQAVLVANIQSMSFFQESYKLRHGVYAVGLASKEEISSFLGWAVTNEDGTAYEIRAGDGSFYQVVATDPDGTSVCLQMPSRQQCGY